jgi:hypothetical protein
MVDKLNSNIVYTRWHKLDEPCMPISEILRIQGGDNLVTGVSYLGCMTIEQFSGNPGVSENA